MRRLLLALAAAAPLACSDDAPVAAPRDATVADAPDAADAPAPPNDAGTFVEPDAAPTASLPEGDCDPLDPSECAYPWPSSLYLRADATRRTGYRLQFGPSSLPSNSAGDAIDPAGFTHLDGFSVGSPVMVRFANVDLSAMATEDHMERSMAADAPALLFKVQGTSLVRVPYWVELDSHEPNAARKTLFLRPAVILEEATRYVVAFRNLRDTAGAAIPRSGAFDRLVAGTTTGDTSLAPRQPRFDEVFRLLEGAGVPRASLTLAWDFNTSSGNAVHGRLLAMRDDALARAGATGPVINIDQVSTFVPMRDGSGAPYDPDIAVELQGSIEVPHYMHSRHLGSFVGWGMNLDANGRPVASGTRQTRFWIRIPHSAINGPPHGLVIYGHGLLGGADEVEAGYIGHIANTHNLIYFAAPLTGMADEDLPGVFASLRNLSYFTSVTDRLHQGVTEWVLLARAMQHRLGAVPEVASRHIQINPDELFYEGNSQGGIFGGTFVAVSPDVHRGYLGVPGENYSTLLARSHDFASFFEQLRITYPEPADQAVGLAAVQLVWDATDPVTHLRHLHQDPYPGNGPHEVILSPAKGDHQVSVLTNEVTARTDIGIPLMANYDNQRTPWSCTQAAYPRTGSGVVLWDFGNPWPPLGNVTPTDTGTDPHELPRRSEANQRQMVNFFRTGTIIDVCGGDGCHPD